VLVARVVARLRDWGGEPATEVTGREEDVVFGLPIELRKAPRASSPSGGD
jgi:hypothetical protein